MAENFYFLLIAKKLQTSQNSSCITKLSSCKTGVINDPLGQTHSFASSEHCFRLKFVLS